MKRRCDTEYGHYSLRTAAGFHHAAMVFAFQLFGGTVDYNGRMHPERPILPPAVQTFSHYPTWPLPIAQPTSITSRHTCGYLPGRLSVFRAFEAEQISPEHYQKLMDAGFRRSGGIIYQPMCPGCRSCVPLRVPVAGFLPSKSQRRVLRHNADLVVRVVRPNPTAEKWELYDRYQREWHDGKQAGDPMGFIQFLYRSPLQTLEFEYRDPLAGDSMERRDGGKLVGVGICDLCPTSLSSVYFFFDPDAAARSLGTFSALHELAWARERKLTHWYAGYWVEGCRQMQYKARFGPAELLGTDGVWRALENSPTSAAWGSANKG